ncbi:MAG: DNA polymerase IV [Acidimicrobiaceae bacterium]|nr:DNA polymerase IV [Acidimicrobiaceae bacterium]MCY4280854.1 DNA polymerase IV [Acidimicrobiaceae bacterium]MCY4294591.1 DNA polymerase IV [Acidimicrobiaceae bacterium]
MIAPRRLAESSAAGAGGTPELEGRPPDGSVGFLHVDMDAFYAAVEVRRRPELRGKPVIVGGAGARGVVATASYEARVFGVRSAMPSSRARRLCPHAVFLPGDHAHYMEVSQRVMEIFHDVTPLVEPLSLDEAFLDVRGAARLLGSAPEVAALIRERVHQQEQLTCSVGAASSKFLAKLASEKAKPRIQGSKPVWGAGIHVVEAGCELDFLHPLKVRELFGVGPATMRRLSAIGVETVGDLATLPETALTAALGDASGRHLHRLAHGIDDRPVVLNRPQTSISHEQTFPQDLHRNSDLNAELTRLGDAVARRLRSSGRTARTVTLKVRFGDFKTVTRSTTLSEPTDSNRGLVDAARRLLAGVDTAAGVRLLGVSVSGLGADAAKQLSFDVAAAGCAADAASGDAASDDAAAAAAVATVGGVVAAEAHEAAERVVDQIRDRFGSSAIGPAVTVRKGRRLRSPLESDKPWGPDAAETPGPASGAVSGVGGSTDGPAAKQG